MPEPPGKPVAVVMGDLVASRHEHSVGHLHRLFNDTVARFNAEFAPSLLSPMTITLGDEFQGIATDLADGFAIVHRVRLHLLHNRVGCRFVVGAVRLETPVNPRRAWNMMGQGLSEARDRLNDKSDPNLYRFSLPDNPAEEELLNVVGLSMTAVESDWTSTQCDFIIAAILRQDTTRTALAKELQTSRRNFYKVLDAGSFSLYRRQHDGIVKSLELLANQAWRSRQQ